jgi:hypothetical protein
VAPVAGRLLGAAVAAALRRPLPLDHLWVLSAHAGVARLSDCRIDGVTGSVFPLSTWPIAEAGA